MKGDTQAHQPNLEVIAGENQREYTMKNVLEMLQKEFPELTISKIRFLESKGLITPERTASGYRKFYDSDIARLRETLRLQKETYMPLEKIKERLDSHQTQEDLFSQPEEPASDNKVTPERPDFYSIAQVASSLNLTVAQIEEMITHGLIAGTKIAGQVHLDPSEVEIVRVVARFLTYGVEPRHLRVYRVLAERQVSFLEQLTAPLLRQRNPQARERANQRLTELRELSERLHILLLDRAFVGLEQLTQPPVR
jgi:DNA-binding transcriptional MerR regulator